MKKGITNLFKNFEEFTKRNQAGLLTGTALVGLAATSYMAYKAGLKAHDILKKRKEAIQSAEESKDTKIAANKEATVEMAKAVVPAVILGVATAGCIVGSHASSARKIALLSAAYSMSESAVKDLNGKMTEVLGEKKTRSIKDAIVKDKLDRGEKPKESNIVITGSGDVLCKDIYSGRYFRSNAQAIGQVINELSGRCQSEMSIALNDLYEELNIPPIPMGNDFGWDVDDLVAYQLPISIVAQLTEDNQPCLCLDYDARLRRDYRSYH